MNRFYLARAAKSLTQQAVAEKLNVTRANISLWESEKALPRAELLPKIAALYGCTVDELLRPEKRKPKTQRTGEDGHGK